jgi:hypothetical protein
MCGAGETPTPQQRKAPERQPAHHRTPRAADGDAARIGPAGCRQGPDKVTGKIETDLKGKTLVRK